MYTYGIEERRSGWVGEEKVAQARCAMLSPSFSDEERDN